MKHLLLVLLIVIAAQTALLAQTEKEPDAFIRENNVRRAENPEGLLFTVRVKDNQKQFHHGEVITLELSFSVTKPNTFTLNAATYDRSGRLHSDGFVVDRREDVVDPLHDYFFSSLFGFIGGGLSGIPELSDKPYVIKADLNEWQRLDKPGRYRLYVVSGRVGRKNAQAAPFANRGVVSNVVEFEILPPDKKWANQRLNELTATLSRPGADRRTACNALRFLGTRAAATEMTKRFRGDDNNCDWQYKFGLIGSPHRDFVIRIMENALGWPEQPITSTFIGTLALLEFMRHRPPPLEPYPNGNEQENSQWQTRGNLRRKAYDELCLNYVRQLILLMPQKQGQARATSLQTVLEYRSQLNAGDLSQLSTLLVSLPEVFRRLPIEAQSQMLRHQWKSIASEAMLPVLRAILKDRHKPDKLQQDDWGFRLVRDRELRTIALRRLYQLSPEEGRQLLVDEIRRPKPSVDAKLLRSLPDETLAEVDQVLLTNLETSVKDGSGDTDIISELIERYATAAILSRVRAIYEAPGVGKWACRPQAALLAYLLRVDPTTGGEHLNGALAARGKNFTRCYESLLTDVARLQMSAELEAAATAALDDSAQEVVSHAATVLGEYGSADTEKALWQRLEKWHDPTQSRSEGVSAQEATEKALRSGRAWLSDPKTLKQLRDLCLTERCDAEVERLITNWNYDITVALSPFDDSEYDITVAHYELKSFDSLKQKLLQFPKGTLFKWKKGDAREFQEIESYLEEHGMKLEREPEKTPQ